MSLTAGTSHEITRTVTADLTADALGNKGVMVLATPCVLTLIENACSEMLQPYLPAGLRLDRNEGAGEVLGQGHATKQCLLAFGDRAIPARNDPGRRALEQREPTDARLNLRDKLDRRCPRPDDRDALPR